MAAPVTHAVGEGAVERVAVSADNRWLVAYAHSGHTWRLVLRPLRDPAIGNTFVALQSPSGPPCHHLLRWQLAHSVLAYLSNRGRIDCSR